MKAAQEEDTVRDRRKAPAEFLGRVGWSVEVPQVFDLVGIEPGFDVGEEAAVDLQMRLQAPHKIKNGGAVPLAYRLRGIEAQANVMISPDADCRYITKQPNRFLDALTPIKHVTQDHEAVRTMLLQHVDGLAQFLGVFVNVGQDAEFHGRFLAQMLFHQTANPDHPIGNMVRQQTSLPPSSVPCTSSSGI